MENKRYMNGFLWLLMLLSILATVKICFMNLNIDEEYAVTLSCRILSEDRMFRDIWEPHQTSGFLTAGLCRLYLTITGTGEYMILYLRICGALLQAAISVFLYRTLRQSFSRFGALTAAFFFYNTLPKQIQTPEFSNMLVWFSVLAMLCFFRACHSEHGRRWLAAAGVFLCGLVLAYPSCILAVPAYFLCLKKLRPKTFRKDAALLFLVCGALGICYIAYFLFHMTLPEFLFGLRQMMTDSYHSDSPWQRLAAYGRELLGLAPHLCLVSVVAGLLFALCRRLAVRRGCCSGWHLFACCILCVSFLEQVCIWLGDCLNFHYPLLHFYLLYGIGVGAYRKKRGQGSPEDRTLFWFGSVCGCCVWLAALLVTNTTISVTGSYLTSGLIPAILWLTKEPENRCEGQRGEAGVSRLGISLTAMGLLGITLFAKGFMVCMNEGLCDNVLVTRQKFLYGPAKSIYGVYMDGYAYNAFAQLLEGYCGPDDSLLYVGEHSVYYLLTQSRIAVHSTISTPSFDSRLTEYWSCFPEHYPTLVVIDQSYDNAHEIGFVKDTLCLGEAFLENEEFAVYRVEADFPGEEGPGSAQPAPTAGTVTEGRPDSDRDLPERTIE